MKRHIRTLITLVLIITIIMTIGVTATAASYWTARQDKAHEIAEIARSMGLPEDDPIIERAREIWWEDYYDYFSTPKPQEKEYELNQDEVNALARTVWGEARGVPSKAEQAAVIWCILNRVDAGYANSIIGVITAPGQFAGYSSSYPVTDEFEELAKDVLIRWYKEKDGETDVGRTLPQGYYYFNGSGGHNWFRQEFRSSSYWDWSLPNPYDS